MSQCFGHSYGFSGSQIIVSEAAVVYNQTQTHLRYIHTNNVSVAMAITLHHAPEEPVALMWASIGNYMQLKPHNQIPTQSKVAIHIGDVVIATEYGFIFAILEFHVMCTEVGR